MLASSCDPLTKNKMASCQNGGDLVSLILKVYTEVMYKGNVNDGNLFEKEHQGMKKNGNQVFYPKIPEICLLS